MNSVSANQHIPVLSCSVREESCNRSRIRLKTRAFSAGLYRSRIIAERCIEEGTLKGAAFAVSSVALALFAAISMAFEMGWKIPWPASCENLL